MSDFFSDPAWKFSALLAAAFGGFLTVWIGKFSSKIYGWIRNQFSEDNRRLYREAKAQVDARREAVVTTLAANPSLLILNTLYIATIAAAVLGFTNVLVSLPGYFESHKAFQAEFQRTFCPIETEWLKFMCGKPWPELEAISDENVVRYLRIAAPALFVPLMLFFVWLWSSLYWLLRAYHRAMGENNVSKPFF